MLYFAKLYFYEDFSLIFQCKKYLSSETIKRIIGFQLKFFLEKMDSGLVG